MEINLYLDQYEQLANLSIPDAIWRIMFWYFGWIPLAILFLGACLTIWLKYRRTKWGSDKKYILLAIDIPKNNVQTPKAVENMFTYLAGIQSTPNLIEYWWEGKYQQCFSFEIISIEGYIQFLVHTPIGFKNIVETAVYSQYPDAEINEVEDYTKDTVSKFPDDEYDIWGCELVPVANQMLPIKVYKEFEYMSGPPEFHYKDPMASFFDLLSSLTPGEQVWFQIILVPINNDWVKKGEEQIALMLGEKKKKKSFSTILMEKAGEAPSVLMDILSQKSTVKEKKADDPLKMINLKPKQKKQVEAITEKISKLAFETKIRFIYLSKKNVMNKAKVANGFVGYIKQFADNGLNGLKPEMKRAGTKAEYFFQESRLNTKKNRIMRAYKNRDDWTGLTPWVFNVEELATIWHFPVDGTVKAPLIQRADARKVEAPMSLPLGDSSYAKKEVDSIFSDDFSFEKELNNSNDKKEKNIENEIVSDSLPEFFEKSEEEDYNKNDNKNEEIKDKEKVPNNLPFV